MSLGNRINEIRKEKGISIDELCARSGVPKGTLSKITADITTNPTLDTVRAIAVALNCQLYDFDDPPRMVNHIPVSPEAMELAKDYDNLDVWGQNAVRSIADIEKKGYLVNSKKTLIILKSNSIRSIFPFHLTKHRLGKAHSFSTKNRIRL